YTLRLTQAPAAGETVTVRVTALAHLQIWNPASGTWVTELAVEFTAATWNVPVTVTLRAADDGIAADQDRQEFAPSVQRVHRIEGALFVHGGDDPAPPVALRLQGYGSYLFLDESSGAPLPVDVPETRAIESAQVDRLIVHDD